MGVAVFLLSDVDTGNSEHTKVEHYSRGITHNLGRMAEEAGIYKAIWRPEEIGIERAEQLIPLLQAGYTKLAADPGYYKQFDAPNKWGVYDDFLPFVKSYLDACKKFPKTRVFAER